MSDPATTPDADSAPGSGPDAGPGSGSVRVVGTAHVSADSVEEVEHTIADERPDIVAVELDEGRYRQMKGEEPDDLDASDLLRGNTVFQFLAYWLLSYVQTKLGDEFDITPGADMLAAIETAEDLDLGVALVDRDIQVTVQRFWTRMTGTEKLRMLLSLPLAFAPPAAVALGLGLSVGAIVGFPLEALFGPLVVPSGLALPGIVASAVDYLLIGSVLGLGATLVFLVLFTLTAPEEDEQQELAMEDLTDADVVGAMLEEFRAFSPGGAEALIDERDAFIAHRLVELREAGHRVVAVVGAGHQNGIERYLDDPERLPPKSELVGRETGRRFSLYKIVGYLFTVGFLAFFILLAMAGARNEFLLRLFGAWFLINGVFAAALARVAGAHWISAGIGGAVAWLTSVNPLLAPGWFAGYVELRYLDVNIGDIGTLNEILGDEEAPIPELLDRLQEVALFRLIAVVALTNVGSIIASFLFLSVVLPYFAAGVDITQLMLDGAQNSVDLIWETVT
jgi:pheromone shutdown protein TraB